MRYPAQQVGAILDAAFKAAPRPPRATKREAAAEKLVAALIVLLDDEGVEAGDKVAFTDARTAVERYRRS